MNRPLIAAAIAMTVLSAPAFAASSTFSMDVGYSTAKLSTPGGAESEYASIRTQIAERCAAEHADLKLAQAYAVRLCTERTLTSTVRKINDPVLTGLHFNRD